MIFAEQDQNDLPSLISEQLQAAFVDPVLIAPQDANAWRVRDRLGHVASVALEEENYGQAGLQHRGD